MDFLISSHLILTKLKDVMLILQMGIKAHRGYLPQGHAASKWQYVAIKTLSIIPCCSPLLTTVNKAGLDVCSHFQAIRNSKRLKLKLFSMAYQSHHRLDGIHIFYPITIIPLAPSHNLEYQMSHCFMNIP